MFFRIKRSTQLKKLMNAYCDRQSVELNSIAFLFDGRRLRGEQTPDEVILLFCAFCSCKYGRLNTLQMIPYLDETLHD